MGLGKDVVMTLFNASEKSIYTNLSFYAYEVRHISLTMKVSEVYAFLRQGTLSSQSIM